MKVRAERDLLEMHLREFRHRIPPRVEIETALAKLTDALSVLDADRKRRAHAFSS